MATNLWQYCHTCLSPLLKAARVVQPRPGSRGGGRSWRRAVSGRGVSWTPGPACPGPRARSAAGERVSFALAPAARRGEGGSAGRPALGGSELPGVPRLLGSAGRGLLCGRPRGSFSPSGVQLAPANATRADVGGDGHLGFVHGDHLVIG